MQIATVQEMRLRLPRTSAGMAAMTFILDCGLDLCLKVRVFLAIPEISPAGGPEDDIDTIY